MREDSTTFEPDSTFLKVDSTSFQLNSTSLETELFDLNDQDLAAFMNDVKRAAAAINKAFQPDKINYGAYGDTLHHLHMHVAPKYEGKATWGSAFEMNPGKTYLSDEEYAAVIEKIKANL